MAFFAIFVTTLYATAVVPYTVYRLRAGPLELQGEPAISKLAHRRQRKAASQQPPAKQPSAALRVIARHHLVLLWLILTLLCWAVWAGRSTIAGFDPYQILGVSQDASDARIRQAYRVLSLEYHPDKNSGAEKAAHFASKITLAYETLTDPNKLQRWKTFGHPDGPQGYEEGVALPSWMIQKGKLSSTVSLLLLLLVVIVLPAWFMIQHLMQYE